jgi:hypothetical protein
MKAHHRRLEFTQDIGGFVAERRAARTGGDTLRIHAELFILR